MECFDFSCPYLTDYAQCEANTDCDWNYENWSCINGSVSCIDYLTTTGCENDVECQWGFGCEDFDCLSVWETDKCNFLRTSCDYDHNTDECVSGDIACSYYSTEYECWDDPDCEWEELIEEDWVCQEIECEDDRYWECESIPHCDWDWQRNTCTDGAILCTDYQYQWSCDQDAECEWDGSNQ